MLSIGDRSGSFPGMLAKRMFRIVLVQPGHGVGEESDSTFDCSAIYDGRGLKIDLGKKKS
jgi:alpha-D-xyloside xylohydrolase